MEFLALLVIIAVIFFAEHIIYLKYGMTKIEYKCSFSTDEAYEGDEIEFIEEISNAKLLPVCWLKSELTSSKWLDMAELESVVTGNTRFISSIFMLRSYHKICRRWKVKCLKRGVFSIEKTTLVASDLFGTETLSMPVKLDAFVRVLPVPLPADSFTDDRNSFLNGDVFVKRQLVSDPFFYNGIHEYFPGDSMKKICWKATAAADELMVYTNDYTAEKSAAVILNCQSMENEFGNPHDEAALEICIKIAASILNEFSEKGVPFGLLSNGRITDEPEPVISEIRTNQLIEDLRVLAELRFDACVSFGEFLNTFCLNLMQTDIYIVTPYIDDNTIAFAEAKACTVIVTTGGIPDNMPCGINVISTGRNFSGIEKAEETEETQ